MKNYKIVIIDREEVMLELSEGLERGGFVTSAGYPNTTISIAASPINKLARFDIVLPEDFIGPAFRKILSFPTPFLFLFITRVDSTDQLFHLEIGVQNIIDRLLSTETVKDPYKTESKDDGLSNGNERPVAGPIAIDSRALQVSVSEFEISLTPIEFKLFRLMASSPQKVFNRRELMELLYGPGVEDNFRTVDSHIAHIRKKISRHFPGQNLIRTVYGKGYSFRIPKRG